MLLKQRVRLGIESFNLSVGDDADERSVFVKNVDYSAEPADLVDHFKECGEVKRVTILYDKAT